MFMLIIAVHVNWINHISEYLIVIWYFAHFTQIQYFCVYSVILCGYLFDHIIYTQDFLCSVKAIVTGL